MIAKTDNFIETLVDGEVVLMHIVDGKFFSLTGTARRTWEILDEAVNFKGLIDALTSEYDVSRNECENQLRSVLMGLRERTLVSIS